MQQGGSQLYGAPPPDMPPFASGTSRNRADQALGVSGTEHLQRPGNSEPPPTLAEAASPISSRAPVGFPDEDALAAAGEEAERGGAPGNRWPRQETLALLKIRSEMDAAFRDANLKAPLWEDVSRKLAELGYKRSAKKCKEKFENVHKYYKRTKDGRAGRQDGKSYRFFSQLEALHSSGGSASTTAASAVPIPAPAPAPAPAQATGTSVHNTVTSSIGMVGSSSGQLQPTPLNTIPPGVGTAPRVVPDPTAGQSGGINFSATSSSSSSESEEDTEEGLPGESRKRKRMSGGGDSGRKMMAFFEDLMRQVMERQEAIQQRFLEAIEKREQDRMIREEAWKRQEVARLNREHEMMAQERAMSASRDAAIIAFLQKITGQTVPVPSPGPQAATPQPQPPSTHYPPPAPVSPPPPEQTRTPPPQRSQSQQLQTQQAVPVRSQPSMLEIVPVPEVVPTGGGGSSTDPASSRWPKSEVHALIMLRSELESSYQETGPKGPLWEEIAARMQRLGYNRSAKRCKEKWENINKYFKKVKESNKKRPEDSKTCPYFHQLDALYRKKFHGSGSGTSAGSSLGDLPKQLELATDPHPQPPAPQQAETEGKSDGGGGGNNSSNGDRNGSGFLKIQARNEGLKPGTFDEGMSSSGSAKKPEDIVKVLANRHQQERNHQATMSDYDKSEELDGDDTDQDDDDEAAEMEIMEYRIHYQQRARANGTSNGGEKKLAAAAAAGSFVTMTQ